MPEEVEDVTWTFSKAESEAVNAAGWMAVTFMMVYLTVMLFVPVLASFRLF